jgi:hypothetical protein
LENIGVVTRQAVAKGHVLSESSPTGSGDIFPENRGADVSSDAAAIGLRLWPHPSSRSDPLIDDLHFDVRRLKCPALIAIAGSSPVVELPSNDEGLHGIEPVGESVQVAIVSILPFQQRELQSKVFVFVARDAHPTTAPMSWQSPKITH